MGKMKMLLKIATTAGPVVFEVVRKYGPQIRKLMDDNPDFFDSLKGRLGALAGVSKVKRGAPRLQTRIEVLRQQTTYLYGTANNASVAEQATAWRRELDGLENSLPVVSSMKGKVRRGNMRHLEERLDSLSAKILALTLEDDIEDAEVIDDAR
ncbi:MULTISPECIES: hypothetical protein [Trueperella]|uniref:Uncharacterized protein n=1 Tax=Trueperella bernardiae TaxID=59561 RepID=A0A0W1KN72_9ACTO|nr:MULTISPECIES: hypothetical protein [Trueperella]KTF05063.1 hypothetical protein AQZ59_00373 [Trueperella bernardiae]MCM3906667.1 hypothetical protein [Trueperella bernardiae]MDK8601168.1 hypothetical protein [Trueperella bernardiae]MDV6238001.1 hypothetical protein [Trueperella bernardiae]OFS68515.1 hypothetical protein HMPREF3174_00795 [Trueperella sp. HMSC08H06]